MTTLSPRSFLAGAALAALVAVSLAARPLQDAEPPLDTAEFEAAMMAAAAKYTQPGPEHELLARFVGDWTTATRMPMYPDAPASEGRSSFRWLMPGRFLISEGNTSMMGMPLQESMILGYDRFKMSYVAAFMSSMDTALRHAEGDLTQDGNTLIVYGTLDEYLTGEHDKMVKYVFRFRGDDEIVMEVHDLPIGETNTMVVEVTFTRA